MNFAPKTYKVESCDYTRIHATNRGQKLQNKTMSKLQNGNALDRPRISAKASHIVSSACQIDKG